MKATVIPPRLRWSCRRGMLELDVLLGNFLEEAFLDLTENDQAIFMRLLASEDQDLFNWLTAKKVSADSQFIDIIKKIRLHAQSRN